MSDRLQGMFWVTAQFVLLAFLVGWTIPWRPTPFPLALGSAGSLLALWVFAHNPPGNFNIRPQPKASGRLVTTGPYRRIRHPMYVALLLITAGIAAEGAGELPGTLWIGLLLVLNFKAALEERLLVQRWPEYAPYLARTRRFIPGLW